MATMEFIETIGHLEVKKKPCRLAELLKIY